MSVAGDFYQFLGGEFIKIEHALTDQLSVADSFLVEDGCGRAIERHFQRFALSIGERESSSEISSFLDSVKFAIPNHGAIFPRLEYREHQPAGERFFLRLRPAPERTTHVSLWASDESDPRISPLIKGPDLSVCQRLRRAANLRGADEAVILDDNGYIADGALSSILWWEGDTLVGPDQSTKWLPSITRELAFELAQQAGFATAQRRAKPEDLQGCEIWSLSALQGIRGVTSWADIKVLPGRFLTPFRKRLAMLSAPIR